MVGGRAVGEAGWTEVTEVGWEEEEEVLFMASGVGTSGLFV